MSRQVGRPPLVKWPHTGTKDSNATRQRSIILREIKAIETEAACMNHQASKAVPMEVLQPLFKNTITVLQHVNEVPSPTELTRAVKKVLQGVWALTNNINGLNKPGSNT